MENKQINIIKVGGILLESEEEKGKILAEFSEIPGAKILVHGGGKLADHYSRKLGISPTMKDGRRITDRDSLDIVTMVYAGLINKGIVATLAHFSCQAVGLTGADGACIQAKKRPITDVDYGYVGDIQYIATDLIFDLLKAGYVPVFAPLSADRHGQILNTNADTIAQSLACALAQKGVGVRLTYLMNQPGVLKSMDDASTVMESLNPSEYEKLSKSGIITQGMIPKLESSFLALKAGVKSVRICGLQHPLTSQLAPLPPAKSGTALVL